MAFGVPGNLPYALRVRAKRRSPENNPGRPGELALIRRIRNRAFSRPGTGLTLGIGDDCALLKLRPGEEAAVTTDLSIAGRHFLLELHPPEVVGHRTLARGLSDLAAMGGRPVAAFVSLGLPQELTVTKGRKPAWAERFYDGLLALAEACKTPLAGGDLAQSPVALADIVLVGAVPNGKALLRSGARVGHVVYVTGKLGGAAAGLERLFGVRGSRVAGGVPEISRKMSGLVSAHLYPQPRIAQGIWLRRRAMATAAIDVSDGLSTDLNHLCEESGVAAEVDSASLPLHPGATLEQALHGGEDYELLFTAEPAARMPRHIGGVPVTRIGRMVRQRKGAPLVTLRTDEGDTPLLPQGWQHFS
jgi:thiamine-monophosphate kinase